MSRCRIRVAAAAVALLPALALGTACNEMFASSPGERLWRRHCAECHGVDGSGNTPRYMGQPYADLRDGTWSYGGDRASIENVTREGIFAKMPAYQEKLTSEEIRQIIDYLYELRGERG